MTMLNWASEVLPQNLHITEQMYIIDYNNSQVLTLYNSKRRMQNILERRSAFNEYFLTPEIYGINIEKRFVIEEYIQRKQISHNNQFTLVFQDILVAQKKSVNNNNVRKYSDEFIECFRTAISRLNLSYLDRIMDFIKCGYYRENLSHGDMYRLNTMFDGQKIYYIDYESVSTNRIFFYDVLYYIMMDIHHFSDDHLYKDYLDGMFDDYIIEL